MTPTNSHFGQRQAFTYTAPVTEVEEERSSLHYSDYLGVGLLGVFAVLLYLMTATPYFQQIDFIGVICRALDIPMAEMEHWKLRETIGGIPASVSAASAHPMVGPVPLRSFIVAIHQASLILGLGGALFLDLYLTQFLFRLPVSQQTLDITRFGSKLVTIGLAAIWLSGIWILYFYWANDPQLLTNPKIWGKLFIVTVLTINGYFIHRYAIRHLESSLGKRILDGDFSRIATHYLTLVSVSVTGWSFAFVLGAFKELNHAISAGTIIMLFLAAVAIVYAAFITACWMLTDRRVPYAKMA